MKRLVDLGAHVTRCARERGVPGDPAYLRFREAVAGGALPFTCQGNENGLVIEGGETLGWEIASQLASSGATVDRLFVQTGGGALGSACIEARDCGVIPRMPRIHAVQTAAAPLQRAWDRVRQHGLDYAIAHRSEFMWPWKTPPRSIATGILDDETYDWAALIRGMQASGGYPIVVSEERLLEAQRLCASHENRGENLLAAPHPPFGHLLPQGEGSHDSDPLPPGTPPREGLQGEGSHDSDPLLPGDPPGKGSQGEGFHDSDPLPPGAPPRESGAEGRVRGRSWYRRSLAGSGVSATGSAGLAGLLELQERGEIAEGETSLVLFTGAAESR